jgi:CO/xanthine dehydrogenase FAD-binding subunit
MAIPLIALDARVEVRGTRSAKGMELHKFFSRSGIKPNLLKYNEVLSEISIPSLPEHSGVSYQKLRLRDTMDFPLLGVAVFLQLEGREGRCRNVRLVLGAVSPSPLLVEDAPELLRGMAITPRLIDEVSRRAQKKAHPVDNMASSPRYRREMIPLLTKRAFEEALESIKNG